MPEHRALSLPDLVKTLQVGSNFAGDRVPARLYYAQDGDVILATEVDSYGEPIAGYRIYAEIVPQ